MAGETAPVPSVQSAFGERFKVSLSSPLAEFDTPGGQAYSVVDSSKPDIPLYALVQNPEIPIRNNAYIALTGGKISNVICPVERGLMTLPMDIKTERLVTIFERPTGGPLFGPDGRHPRLDAKFMRTSLPLSLVKALASLHKKGINHRRIRPDNMFFSSKESNEIYLGECCSCPAGYLQPDNFDPLDVVFADPISRGEASSAADFYQMGAAIITLYLNNSMEPPKDKNTALITRVNQSSYSVLSGGQDVPGSMGVLLRGLLLDDPQDRWKTEDVLSWFESSFKERRIGMTSWSMSRPTNYKGVSYVDKRLLAQALAEDPNPAAAFIRSLDFVTWVQVSMADDVISEKVGKLLNVSAADTGMGHEENFKLVARFCLFLHPTGPIRYKNISVYPDAIPASVASAFEGDDRDKVRVFSELFEHRFLSTLVDIMSGKLPDEGRLLNSYIKCGVASKSTSIGMGMERVLYDLNPTLPCRSLKFDRNWVGSIKHVLLALDRLASKASIKSVLQDRHIAAFMVSRDSSLDKAFTKLDVAKNDMPRFNALTTELVGKLQRELKIVDLPHLTSKLVDGLMTVVKALKNRNNRDKLLTMLEKLKKSGDIGKLSKMIDVPKVQAQDSRDFTRARYDLLKMNKERDQLLKPVKITDYEVLQKGYNGSRNISLLSVIGTIILFL